MCNIRWLCHIEISCVASAKTHAAEMMLHKAKLIQITGITTLYWIHVAYGYLCGRECGEGGRREGGSAGVVPCLHRATFIGHTSTSSKKMAQRWHKMVAAKEKGFSGKAIFRLKSLDTLVVPRAGLEPA